MKFKHLFFALLCVGTLFAAQSIYAACANPNAHDLKNGSLCTLSYTATIASASNPCTVLGTITGTVAKCSNACIDPGPNNVVINISVFDGSNTLSDGDGTCGYINTGSISCLECNTGLPVGMTYHGYTGTTIR